MCANDFIIISRAYAEVIGGYGDKYRAAPGKYWPNAENLYVGLYVKYLKIYARLPAIIYPANDKIAGITRKATDVESKRCV